MRKWSASAVSLMICTSKVVVAIAIAAVLMLKQSRLLTDFGSIVRRGVGRRADDSLGLLCRLERRHECSRTAKFHTLPKCVNVPRLLGGWLHGPKWKLTFCPRGLATDRVWVELNTVSSRTTSRHCEVMVCYITEIAKSKCVLVIRTLKLMMRII